MGWTGVNSLVHRKWIAGNLSRSVKDRQGHYPDVHPYMQQLVNDQMQYEKHSKTKSWKMLKSTIFWHFLTTLIVLHFSIWRFPKLEVSPNNPFYRIFHCKPSIVGYPHFRTPPIFWESTKTPSETPSAVLKRSWLGNPGTKWPVWAEIHL